MEAGVSTYICLTFYSWKRNSICGLDASLLNSALPGRLTFGNQTLPFVPYWVEAHRSVKCTCLLFLHFRTLQKRQQFLSLCSSTFLPVLGPSEMIEPKQSANLLQACDRQNLPSLCLEALLVWLQQSLTTELLWPNKHFAKEIFLLERSRTALQRDFPSCSKQTTAISKRI